CLSRTYVSIRYFLWSAKSIGVQDLPDFCRKSCARKWLLQEGRALVKPMAVNQGVIGIAGHIQYLDPRAQNADALANVTPACFRQNHVGEQQMDIPRVFFAKGFHIV